MRIYDCTHKNIENLQNELLFKEVMRLRNIVVDAECLLEEFVEDSITAYAPIKKRAKEFLNKKL